MTPVFYAMMILGCGDGNSGCVPARIDQARFATMAACRAELTEGIARNTDLSFPVIAADCRRSSPVTIAKANGPAPRG